MDVTAHAHAESTAVQPLAPDRLGAEVRESALLLVLSLAVTAGVASGVQALLSVLA